MGKLGTTIKKAAIEAAKGGINLVYSVEKLHKTHNQVCMISRESNSVPFEFQMIADELATRGIRSEIYAMKLDGNYVEYALNMLKQMKSIARSRVLLIDTYCISASVLNHKANLTIIQMWHALAAIKKFGWQAAGNEDGRSELIANSMRMHYGYNHVLCASDATSPYFCEAFRCSGDVITKIGLPRIDYILREDTDVIERINEKYNLKNNKKTILYVPTFRKGRPVEWRDFAEAIDKTRYDVIVKLHPLDAISADETSDGIHIDADFNSYDLLKAADIVISDYSAFVIEASLLNKPMYLYVYDLDEYRDKVGINVDYSEEAISSYAYKDKEQLIRALEAEYDFSKLKAFRDKYIDVDCNNCTAQIADLIESHMQ